MAAKKKNPAFEFLVTALKANQGAAYADLKAKAETKGMTIYPVMFGRAKAMLGLVKSAKRGEGKAAKAASKPVAKRGRPAGGGSKTKQVLTLFRSGLSAAEIAKQVGCTVGLVYNVKSKSGAGAGATRRGPGRPKKSTGASQEASFDSLEEIVRAVKASGAESARMRKAIERIQAIVQEVL